jgi:ribonuclease G
LPPADAGTTEEEAKKKRRRGSRGGRNRKRPAGTEAGGGAAATVTVATGTPEAPKAKAEKPDARRKPREERSDNSKRERTPRRRVQPKRMPLPAAKRQLLVSVDVGEQRVAVLEDDRVAEVYLERPERRSIAGNIYKGTVDNVLPGMEAAFVEIGLEKNGFLYVDEIVVPELEGKRHGRKIQDLLSRGQEILVQAVKDPMKSKGARLTTEISLPGRFVVYVPYGEGLGVSRRLEDDERARLRDILKGLELPSGGLIVRTAAEGASAEDVERDVVFLQRLWKSIQTRAKELKAPALVYQEAELPLRVVRDLFTDDFEQALVDDDRTYRRIVGYLKKTSPHVVERVIRYRDKQPLFETSGVDAEIRSTLSRRVDLPSGGYLVFDYAEAFTVIDVNTGRFTGSRSKSGAGLEETITKNNLEAVTEVVRQLRLRDIGGIIVIDFIDMANPRNRAQVEEALRQELERDRTKTYVVEISPLGLVEMTRQNVTDGPREILTKRCPTCAGDGIVLSEISAAVDAERRLRALASQPRVQAFRVELNAHVRDVVVGPGASRLAELEERTRRRFFLTAREGVPLDHFVVAAQGKLAELAPSAPVAEGDSIEFKLVEIGLHDPGAGVGRVGGFPVAVGAASKFVGKKVKARVTRVLDGVAFADLVEPAPPAAAPVPVTAESEAEKPTRRARARKAGEPVVEPGTEEPLDELEEIAEEDVEDGQEEGASPRRKTRRGSRGGRGRKRKPAADVAAEANGDLGLQQDPAEREPSGDDIASEPPAEAMPAAAPSLEAMPEARLEAPPQARAKAVPEPALEAGTAEPETDVPAETNGTAAGAVAELPTPRIHIPDAALGREENGDSPDGGDAGPSDDGEQAKARKRTRRGSRGGRNRRKKVEAAVEGTTAATVDEAAGDEE